MPSWRHLLLLVVIVDVTSAGLKNVVVVQNFNLKTAVAAEISCSNIKSVLVEGRAVGSYSCAGATTTTNNTQSGMWIVVETQTVIPKDKTVSWRIEYTTGYLASSFTVDKALYKPLSSTVSLPVSISTKALSLLSNRVPSGQDDKNITVTTIASSEITTLKPTTESKAPEPSKAPTKPPTSEAPTPEPTTKPTTVAVNVTVGYIQFQTGKENLQNQYTQAVVTAVIEGLLLGAILFVFLFKCYQRSKLRTAGMYPTRNDFQKYKYSAGSSDARPEIPSYRSQDSQPPLRLDSLTPRPAQQVVTPTLMPDSSRTLSPPVTTVQPAPLNYWPDQPQPQPVKNIMDSDL
ncbi:unnamed protein product [Heligmosomoides polygyrus]|uniref:Transmembrane protein n=1 Tax=Heligmosomoides polygyrus TaxID=6339 RepID=A0A3P8BFB4_HELPZ|nr:unnamed protein product [Heligmosomoides polygyrus]